MLRSLLAFTACWMCSVGPVGLSIAVGVSFSFIGLTLMWYRVYVVVVALCGACYSMEACLTFAVKLASYDLLQEFYGHCLDSALSGGSVCD